MTPLPRHPHTAAGFTLVELAAVLAVTAIIGAMGVSAYRTYAVRAQIASGIAGTKGVRDHVTAAFRTTGIPPANRETAGLAPDRDPAWGDYVDDLDVARGRVDIHFGRSAAEAIAGRTLSMTPFETADQRVVWLCGNKLPGPGLEPLGFAGGAPQPVQVPTLIDARYLPPGCR
jgi:prepilin-type N-terminal cleavage/methylation domain-containing protein